MSRRTRARRPHRTWPQRLLISFNVCCIILALVGAGTLAYAKRKVGEIDRYEFSKLSDPTSPGFDSDQPRNFLLVGADSDDGLAADDPARAGRGSVGGIRSDTIMVVRVDPKSHEAKVVSFPRDLWVDIPGSGKGRINSSLEFGGPDKLIETIKSNFDIDINHYVQVNFAGFKSLVDQIGGVPVYFATPVKDQGGLNVTSAGCNTLDGTGALAYVRARHMKYLNENGYYASLDGTSDLGRISRQQDFIKRVLRGAIKKGARNPRTLASLINTGVDNIRLDQGTTAGDLIALGQAFRSFDPNALQTYNLPVTDTVRGGAAVLDLQTGGAEPILAKFRGTGEVGSSGELTPATIAVMVLNGSGTQNQAGEASSLLATAGFKMSEPGSSAGVLRTQVRYAPGMEAQAALVARHLFATPELVADPDVSEITVVTGPDFRSALVEARPEADIPVPTTTTSTTAPTTTVDPGASSSSTNTTAASTTTSTTAVGYVPGAAPPGEKACG
ncbi:LCP family protein [Aquihabitans daechungensis]|uniref:LCP family protein n=1 Tax=Aquihabitans daechungensis TaxID=1052257 RepID=UPI003BA12D4D